MMAKHKVVSRDAWIAARKRLLAKEKRFTRLRDRLSEERRALPWERVDKDYVFQGPKGKESLAQLFDGRSQLIVYHFMFAPDWEEGCKSCSFWAGNFNGIAIHLNHRDVTFTAVSRAPLAKINAYRRRMGWSFPWVSSFGSDFNFDYHTSFASAQIAEGKAYYNYKGRPIDVSDEAAISVFSKNERGEVFHTYSCYGRGIAMLNGVYQYLDLCPEVVMRTASTFR